MSDVNDQPDPYLDLLTAMYGSEFDPAEMIARTPFTEGGSCCELPPGHEPPCQVNTVC